LKAVFAQQQATLYHYFYSKCRNVRTEVCRRSATSDR